MKSTHLLTFLLGLIFLPSCNYLLPDEEHYDEIIFYTDKLLDINHQYVLLVNDEMIGQLTQENDMPTCERFDVVRYTNDSNDDLHLQLLTEDGERKDIGVINLFSVSNGIKIKPINEGGIMVNRLLEDDCTKVKVDW